MTVLELGGNIRLSGFDVLDPAQMVVVKKIVGNYAKRYSERSSLFQALHLALKEFTTTAVAIEGTLHLEQMHTATVTNENLFFALDAVLRELEGRCGT